MPGAQPGPSPALSDDPGPDLAGFSQNRLGALAYLTCIPALAFLLFAPYNRNRFIRFHSFQCLYLTLASICGTAFSSAVSVFSPLNGALSALFGIVLAAMWAFAMCKAWRGERFRVPLVGSLAAGHADTRTG